VVVPTYSEEGNLGPLLTRVKSLAPRLNDKLTILIVNDGADNDLERVSSYMLDDGNMIVLLQQKGRRGLGFAYKSGFRYALNNFEPTTFVQMDGDLQHPPEKIPELVNMICNGYDVAIASRYVHGSERIGLSRRREIFSKLINSFLCKFLRLEVSDATSGFRALSRKAVEYIISDGVSASGFAFQVETLSMLKRKGMRIEETSFCFYPRVNGRSKLLLTNPFDFVRSIILTRIRNYLQ